MYRGLTANQQVGDRYGRSTTGIAASLAASNNNATSNGEYGGWFGYSGGVSHPASSRATSETIWRTGNSSTPSNTTSIQDIMQLLKQGQTLSKPVMANVTRSGTNGLRLVGGSRANASVQQGPPPGFSVTTDQATTAPNQASQGNRAEERHHHNGEHLGPANHLLPGDGSQTRWPVGGCGGPAEITGADHMSPSKATGVQQQRGFNGHSPAAYQRLAGSIQADPTRIMKSATTLGFATERTNAADEQNHRHLKGPGSNGPVNRNIYNAGPTPIWSNRWSHGRPQYRLGQTTARPGPMTTNEANSRQEPSVYLKLPDGGSNAQGAGQFNTDTGRSAPWQTTGNGEDVGSAVLANRLREDRNQFHPERVHSKLETVTPVEFMSPAKQKPVLSASISDENASKFGRYGLGPASFERNNQSYPPKLVPEGFRSDGSGLVPGSGTVPSNGSMFSQLDHENKVANVPKISDESFVRSPGYPSSVPSPRLGTSYAQQGPLSTPRLGTNRASQGPGFNATPKRSILKKPKVHSNDYESGINAKRRTELYPMRHSAGSVGYFNGLSHVSGVDGFQNRRHDSNQKRVTFKLDQ